MPLYVYECEWCKKRWEASHPIIQRYREWCNCGRKPRIVVGVGTNASRFIPYQEWNLDPSRPIEISSAAQLDRECDRRGLRVRSGGKRSRARVAELERYHQSLQRAIDRR